MKKLIISVFLAFIIFGCVTQMPSYKDGCMVDVGLYLPYSGSLYGLDLMSYVSGCKIYCPTNTIYSIERQTSTTNTYFGMISIKETNHTKVTYLPKNNEK